jgi:uncharacterized membrane protein YdjX (TVP38/TMEM64 family)
VTAIKRFFSGERGPFVLFLLALAFLWAVSSRVSLGGFLLRPFSGLPAAAAGLLFVVLYVVVTFFLWFSKDILRLSAALAFGPLVSTLLVWLAEMGNCCALFFFARRMGKGYVEKSLPERFRRMYDGSRELGFGWLLLLRCAPVVPFRFLDLGAGLSPMRFRRYFLSAAVGSPLRIFWLQAVLAGAGTAALKGPAAISGYLERDPALLWFSFLYLAFMAGAWMIVKMKERTCQ